MQVNKVSIKSALIRYFTSFGGIPVASSDLRNESLAVLGGLVYYQGTLVHAQAGIILKTVSEYIEYGNGKQHLFVSNYYLEFLPSCPVVMNGQHESCTFDAYDAAALNCSLLKAESQPVCSESQISFQLALYVFILSGVVVVLLSTCLLAACCRLRTLRLKLSKSNVCQQKLVDAAKHDATNRQATKRQIDVQTVLSSLNSGSCKRRQDSLDSAIGEGSKVSSTSWSSSSSPSSSDSVGANDVFHYEQIDSVVV